MARAWNISVVAASSLNRLVREYNGGGKSDHKGVHEIWGAWFHGTYGSGAAMADASSAASATA